MSFNVSWLMWLFLAVVAWLSGGDWTSIFAMFPK